MGDIHGHLDKLQSVLKQCNFDYDNDTLIQLGDIVDRGPDSRLCIDELLKIKNLIAIQGNHDEEWFNSIKNGNVENGLLWKHGALQTYESYYKDGINPEVHYDFLNNQLQYYILEVDDKTRYYFVHGGFNRHYFINEQIDPTVYTWDRDLWLASISHSEKSGFPFKIKGNPTKVFIGHTPTMYWDSTVPMKSAGRIINVDTGSGKGGLLTIMNIHTEQYWQA